MAKNILITGGCGFIGSSFINTTFESFMNKCNIVVLDNLSNCSGISSIEKHIRNSNRFTFINGDFGNSELVLKLLRKHTITHILNLAVTSYQPKTLGNPVHYVNNNILNTTKFLQACHEYGKLKKIVHLTSFLINNAMKSVDRNVKNEYIDEYLVTKSCSLQVITMYRDTYKLPIVIGFGSDIFGETQCPLAPVLDYALELHTNGHIKINSNSDRSLNYVYISDAVNAIVAIFEKGTIGMSYNIVDKNACHTDMQVAKMMVNHHFGLSPESKHNDYSKYIREKNGIKMHFEQCPDDNLELKKLGWSPKIGGNSGLKRVMDFYNSEDGAKVVDRFVKLTKHTFSKKNKTVNNRKKHKLTKRKK
jgi:dTDP-glucose 4,6-dehydratase